MASIRGTSRGPHPSLPPLLIPQEETLSPSRGPSWRFEKPWPGGGLVLGAGGAVLSARNPCLRREACTLLPEPWWLEQGLLFSMDTRHFVQGWPGIPLFPGLDLPHTPTGPWLGLLSWPSAPLPLLAGAGIPAGFPSIFRPTYNIQLPSPTAGKLSRLGWSPME